MKKHLSLFLLLFGGALAMVPKTLAAVDTTEDLFEVGDSAEFDNFLRENSVLDTDGYYRKDNRGNLVPAARDLEDIGDRHLQAFLRAHPQFEKPELHDVLRECLFAVNDQFRPIRLLKPEDSTRKSRMARLSEQQDVMKSTASQTPIKEQIIYGRNLAVGYVDSAVPLALAPNGMFDAVWQFILAKEQPRFAGLDALDEAYLECKTMSDPVESLSEQEKAKCNPYVYYPEVEIRTKIVDDILRGTRLTREQIKNNYAQAIKKTRALNEYIISLRTAARIQALEELKKIAAEVEQEAIDISEFDDIGGKWEKEESFLNKTPETYHTELKNQIRLAKKNAGLINKEKIKGSLRKRRNYDAWVKAIKTRRAEARIRNQQRYVEIKSRAALAEPKKEWLENTGYLNSITTNLSRNEESVRANEQFMAKNIEFDISDTDFSNIEAVLSKKTQYEKAIAYHSPEEKAKRDKAAADARQAAAAQAEAERQAEIARQAELERENEAQRERERQAEEAAKKAHEDAATAKAERRAAENPKPARRGSNPDLVITPPVTPAVEAPVQPVKREEHTPASSQPKVSAAPTAVSIPTPAPAVITTARDSVVSGSEKRSVLATLRAHPYMVAAAIVATFGAGALTTLYVLYKNELKKQDRKQKQSVRKANAWSRALKRFFSFGLAGE